MRGLSRSDRVALSRARDPEAIDRAPVASEGAVEKLRAWDRAGAEIVYLSARRTPEGQREDADALERLGFPRGRVLSRANGESYGDVAARERPDVVVEDDCESIGAAEMTYPQLPAELRARVRSVVVPEFGGLAHLSDDPRQLGR